MESVYKIGNIGDLIKDNSYVGRGVVIGESENGKNAVFAYFIMGRSENSRNRIFKDRGEEVTIYPFDESKVEDPAHHLFARAPRGKQRHRDQRRPDGYGVRFSDEGKNV